MAVRKLNQDNVIVSAPKVEHLAIRRRDWDRIRKSLKVCRPPIPWMSNAGWLAGGGGIGGIFSAYTLVPADPVQQARISTGAVSLMILGLILLYASWSVSKRTKDDVATLQEEMTAIEAECDMTAEEQQATATLLAKASDILEGSAAGL